MKKRTNNRLSKPFFLGLALWLSLGMASLQTAQAQSAGPAIIEQWVSQSQNIAFLELSYQSMSYSAAEDKTQINGFTLTLTFSNQQNAAPSLVYQWRIPHLDLTALHQSDNFYTIKRIETDEIYFTSFTQDAAQTHAIIEGQLSQIIIDDLRFAPIPPLNDDVTQPFSRYYAGLSAIQNLSLSRAYIGASQFIRQSRNSDMQWQIDLGAVTIETVTAGNIAAITYDGHSIHLAQQSSTENATNKPIIISSGPMQMKALNLGTLIKLFNPDQTPSESTTPYQSVLGGFIAEDLSLYLAQTGLSFAIKQIAISNADARGAKIQLLSALDTLYTNRFAQFGGEPTPEEIDKVLMAFLGMWRLGTFETKSIEIKLRNEVRLYVGILGLRALSSSGLKEFVFKQFQFQNPEIILFRVGTFQIANVLFPEYSAFANLSAIMKSGNITAILTALPTIEKILISEVTANTLNNGAFKLAAMQLTMGNFINRFPSQIIYTISRLQLPANSLPPDQADLMKKLRYDPVTASYKLSFIWNETRNILDGSAQFVLEDASSLTSSIRIGGITRSLFESPMQIPDALSRLTFHSANIYFQDYSIIERVVSFVAVQKNTSPQQITQQILSSTPFVIGSILNDKQLVDDLTDAIATMINTNGSALSIQIDAIPPISFGQIMSLEGAQPDKLTELLKQVQIEIAVQ